MPEQRTGAPHREGTAAPTALIAFAYPILPGLVGLMVAVLALILRPPAPLDELRYLAVAWEMWLRGDFLVPHLNGAAYSHKPPLLFWLIHAGWALFGVNAWWPRLVPGLAALVAVSLAGRLGQELWPADTRVAAHAPWLLAGSIAWVFCVQMVMFDLLLTAWVIIGMCAIWNASRRAQRLDFLLLGLALAGGLLSKGPVILLHLLVPAALAPVWEGALRGSMRQWYARIFAALAFGTALALAWALPAALRGGPEYASAIFWHQTAGRVENSFAHARAWWYYLLVLPALALPWTAMPATWRRLASGLRDPALRFLLVWLGSVLIAMSAVSAKQPHYLLPVIPALALLIARLASLADLALADRLLLTAVPAALALAGAACLAMLARAAGLGWSDSGALWTIPALPACVWLVRARTSATLIPRAAMTMAFVLVLLLAGVVQNPVSAGHDLRRPAAHVATLQEAGAKVVAMSSYQGQLTWLGRLSRPIPVVAREKLAAWSATHPGTYVLAFKDPLPDGVDAELVGAYPYRSGQLRIWRVSVRG